MVCTKTKTTIAGGMEVSAGHQLSTQSIARLTVLAFLHDIGKANSGFQAKRWLDQIPPSWPVRIKAGHGVEVFKLFEEPSAVQAIEPLIEQICTWGEVCDSLLIASISHHGRPLKEGWGVSSDIWKSFSGKYDPAIVLQEIAARVQKLYPLAFKPGGQPLPEAPAFGHLFAGLVQLADWLGSDDRLFKYSKPDEDRAATAPFLADKAVATLGLDVENWREQLVAARSGFEEIFQVPAPYPIQAAMSDDSFGPLVILESETGSGKTEAALWRYSTMVQRNASRRAIFGLIQPSGLPVQIDTFPFQSGYFFGSAASGQREPHQGGQMRRAGCNQAVCFFLSEPAIPLCFAGNQPDLRHGGNPLPFVSRHP